MSLKQELKTWVAALARYDNNEFEEALREFGMAPNTSKILFNMGVIHATLGEHERAVECYQHATKLDKYLAVAYFQQGVSNFLLGDFAEAQVNFERALINLRNNSWIDYTQLGLLFRLYSCEIRFNRGLCYMYLQQKDVGMQHLTCAAREKIVEDHNVIDEAIRERAEGYTVFSIPVGVVFRPNEAKIRNLQAKDYLGKARLVATPNHPNASAGSTITEPKHASLSNVKDDRPAESMAPAAAYLSNPALQSTRQQSEPPANSSFYPPTPPPDNDRANRISTSSSVRSGTRPALTKLNIEGFKTNSRYERSSPESQPLSAPSRTHNPASVTPDRGHSQRDSSRHGRTGGGDGFPDELYDVCRGARGQQQQRPQQQQRWTRPRSIEEEEEEEGEERGRVEREGVGYRDGASFDEGDFEMASDQQRQWTNSISSAGGNLRASSRQPELRKVRVKVHAGVDVRYIMVGVAIQFPDLVDRIREKFSLRGRLKLKVRDDDAPESEMITMADQDDLDVAMMTAREVARRQRLDTGRMEVWVYELEREGP